MACTRGPGAFELAKSRGAGAIRLFGAYLARARRSRVTTATFRTLVDWHGNFMPARNSSFVAARAAGACAIIGS